MIGAIFATDENWGFGNKGKMPWPSNTDDFSHFRKVTLGTRMVMGRKTFESLPGLLDKREHHVISRDMEYHGDSVHVHSTITDCMNVIGNDFWVIGGVAILNAFKHAVEFDVVYHTVIEGRYECDVILNKNEILKGLTQVSVIEKNGCKIYKYVKDY